MMMMGFAEKTWKGNLFNYVSRVDKIDNICYVERETEREESRLEYKSNFRILDQRLGIIYYHQ